MTDVATPASPATDAAPVLSERLHDGRVARLTLNRPHVANAMSTHLAEVLSGLLADVADDPRVRVVILTGAGDRAFSAGGDLKERQGMTPAQWVRQHRLFEHVYAQVRQLRKPIFAAVNGVAAGGGCELAMNCDFIVAAEQARFGQPEVKRGIIPGAGGTQFLPRLVPRGMAMELLMTGELIGAPEAQRLGLVNRVVPGPELQAAAEQLALLIAANSPTAVQQAKKAARLGVEQPIEPALELELACYAPMVDHPDRYEGVNAFNERRAPNFQDAI